MIEGTVRREVSNPAFLFIMAFYIHSQLPSGFDATWERRSSLCRVCLLADHFFNSFRVVDSLLISS